MKTNVKDKSNVIRTHEGAIAKRINPEQQLRRSVLACLLWEDSFYEDGESIANRILKTLPLVSGTIVADLALEARTKYKLRHVPLLIARGMAGNPDQKHLVAGTLEKIIQRADELAEFLSIYWADKRQPLSAQVKKGLAKAFTKFNAYQLAKYNRDGKVKLRDVLFLCHAKPKDKEQELTWKKLVDGTLESPDTWEVSLSAGADKKETWERLLIEKKLGGLALLRNLRNMEEANVSDDMILDALKTMNVDRVLPYRFISAAKHAPRFEAQIEKAMMKCLDGKEKLPGKTILLVDTSGSMEGRVSSRSDISRMDTASGLAILARELCEDIEIYVFANACKLIPSRNGFALRDVIFQTRVGFGTDLGLAVDKINHLSNYDRLIVITDEQSNTDVPNPKEKGYMINVGTYENGIGYGAWTHIDGFSDAVLDYIIEIEKENL